MAGLICLLLCVGASIFAQGAVAQDSSSGLDQYLERKPDAGAAADRAGGGGGDDDGGGSGGLVLVIALVALVGGGAAALAIQRRRNRGEAAG